MDYMWGDEDYWKKEWWGVMDELTKHFVIKQFIEDLESVLVDLYFLLDDD